MGNHMDKITTHMDQELREHIRMCCEELRCELLGPRQADRDAYNIVKGQPEMASERFDSDLMEAFTELSRQDGQFHQKLIDYREDTSLLDANPALKTRRLDELRTRMESVMDAAADDIFKTLDRTWGKRRCRGLP